MKIIVSTHQGKLYDEDIEYVVVHSQDGEFAILANHVPTIAVISKGYVKMVLDKQELYLAVENGMLEFANNVVHIIAQAAHIGKDKESAQRILDTILAERINSNRKESADFVQKEKEIFDNLRNTKASDL